MGCTASGMRSGSVKPGPSGPEREVLNTVLPEAFCEKYELVPDMGRNPPVAPVLLGTGSFSKVYKCRNRATGEFCAVKYVDTKRLFAMRGAESVERTINEVQRGVAVLKQLDHPAIIKLYDYFESKNTMAVVLEFGGMELYDFVVNEGKLSESDAAYITRNVVEAVAHMHGKGLVHRDLKPENIVKSGDTWKIIDFGFSRAISVGSLKSFVGTKNYAAPEILRREPYDKSVDVWSIGVITFVLLVGFLPFNPTSQNKNTYKLVLEREHWSAISIAAKSFVARILVEDATQRPTSEELLEMSFLNMEMHAANNASTQSILKSPKRLSLAGGVQYVGDSPGLASPRGAQASPRGAQASPRG